MSAVVLRQESTTKKNSRQKIRQIVFPNFYVKYQKSDFILTNLFFNFLGSSFSMRKLLLSKSVILS